MQEKNTGVIEAQKTCELSFDASEIRNQLDELTKLLTARFPEGIPNEILSNLSSLRLDVIFTDPCSTLSADGTIKILNGLRFGSSFERLRATILAGEWDTHKEATPS